MLTKTGEGAVDENPRTVSTFGSRSVRDRVRPDVDDSSRTQREERALDDIQSTAAPRVHPNPTTTGARSVHKS